MGGKDNRAISVLLGEAWKSLAAEDRELYSGKAKGLADEQKKLYPDCWKRKAKPSSDFKFIPGFPHLLRSWPKPRPLSPSRLPPTFQSRHASHPNPADSWPPSLFSLARVPRISLPPESHSAAPGSLLPAASSSYLG